MISKLLMTGIVLIGMHTLLCIEGIADDAETAIIASDGDERKLVFRSRVKNAPRVRVDGGAGHLMGKIPCLYVLAPQQVGYTIMRDPNLYWFQSLPSDGQFKFVLADSDSSEPILTFSDVPAEKTGIQRVRLSDHNIKLSTGKQYSWHVKLVGGTEDSNQDILASAMIEIIDPPLNVMNSLVTRKKQDLVYIFAEEGLWYDAIDTISGLVESNPHEQELRELRADLLDQGELVALGDMERSYGGK